MDRGRSGGRGDWLRAAEHGVNVSTGEACVDGHGGLVLVVRLGGVRGEAHGVEKEVDCGWVDGWVGGWVGWKVVGNDDESIRKTKSQPKTEYK